MKFKYTEHILVEDIGEDFIKVSIDDLELFDFIDDYFSEECNFENCLHQQLQADSDEEIQVILIPKEYSFKRVCDALIHIDIAEIERIYAVNNI